MKINISFFLFPPSVWLEKKLEHRSSFILWKPYKWKLLEAGLRTVAVLVKIVQRVETRLLLLVCLERVAGLQIGVLHDPAGPEGKEGKEKHGSQAQTKTRHPLLMNFIIFSFSWKTNPKTKSDSSFSRHTQIFSDRVADLWLLTLYPKSKCKHLNPPLLSTHSPLKPFNITLFIYRSCDSPQPRLRKKKDDSARTIRNKMKLETSEHSERQKTGS